MRTFLKAKDLGRSPKKVNDPIDSPLLEGMSLISDPNLLPSDTKKVLSCFSNGSE